jgi:two-component system sensor histidine kinase ChiS
MRIRTKLLLTMMVPLALLITQITAVNAFIRELQSAVSFVSSAHSLIEADLAAADLVHVLRTDVKKLPSHYVMNDDSTGGADPMAATWEELTAQIALISSSEASSAVGAEVLEPVTRRFAEATLEYQQTLSVAGGGAADLESLLERAIAIDRALSNLDDALKTMAVDLRGKLQVAVDEERKIHNRPIQAAAIIGVLAVILLIGFTWVIAAYVIRPVRDLMDGASRLAQGELDQRVPVRTKDEVGVLARTFNDMAGQLQQSFDTLARQNEELQRLDKLKDEFLANTSHELRTPLNGIIGLAESIADGATGPLSDVTRKNLSMIVSSGRRLASLVNDILDFSKLKNQAFELRTQPLDVHALSEVVISLSSGLIGNKPLRLINSTAPDLPLVDGDENRVQQILLNLVGNAIKFTEAGVIDVSAQAKGDSLAITVADTGIGISPDQTEHIFDSFQQADGAVSRRYGGTGLGLAVSRQLVELHGGRLTVESEQGAGSRFTFTLPLSNPDAVAPRNQPVAHIRSDEQPAPSYPVEGVEPPEPIAVARPATDLADGARHSVLVVDDEPINLQVLVNHLAAQDYAVTLAQSGVEALRLIEQGQFDLVVLDVMMPRMSGYEVCRTLRLHYPAHELPVLMLTAKNQVPDLVAGFEAGANDYLTKPFSKEELLTRLGNHLQLLKTTQSFGRFVPREYLKFLGRDNMVDIRLGDHISKEMTVMFSDLRGFTTLSESMSPQENFDFINNYLERTSPVVRDHNGFIVKYLGDGMMAVFPECCDDALDAGIEKIERIRAYNEERKVRGDEPIELGIGVNAGHMMVGIIGESSRMQGDALSDNVNLSSRVEGLTKFYSVSLIITEAAYRGLAHPERYNIRFLDRVQVKGRSEALDLYEVFDGDDAAQRELKQATQSEYAAALELYYKRDFSGAQAKLFGVLQQNPRDKVAWHHLVQATGALESGAAETWTGVTAMQHK